MTPQANPNARGPQGPGGKSPAKIAFGVAVAVLLVAAVAAAAYAVYAFLGMSGQGGQAGSADGEAGVAQGLTVDEVYENMTSANDGALPDITYGESEDVPLFVNGRFTDRAVNSGADAVAAVGDIAPLFGVRNASEELSPIGETTYDGITYYRMQQTYKGLEVYGHQLVVSAVDGSAATVSGEFVPDISLDVDSALELADEGADLVVYVTEDNGPEVAVRRTDSAGVSFFSLSTGELIGYESKVHFDSATGHAKIDGVNYEFDTTSTGDGSYELSDTARNLFVYDANDKTFRAERLVDESNKRVVAARMIPVRAWFVFSEQTQVGYGNFRSDPNSDDSTGILFSDSDSDPVIASGLVCTDWSSDKHVYVDDIWEALDVVSNESDDWSSKPEAAKAMAYAQRLYDYYAEKLDWHGFDNANSPFYIVVNDHMDGIKNSHSMYDIITFSTSRGVANVMVGHEYAHSTVGGVIGEDSQLHSEGEWGALNEAYADILGILATDTLSWRIEDADRYLDNPTSKGQQCAFYKGKNWVDTANTSGDNDHGGVHTNCTVIGHAAYLMNDKGITRDDLAKIWFTSLNHLTPKATFVSCRAAVIAAAEELGYGDDVINIIKESFNEVGLDGSGAEGAISTEARVIATDRGDHQRMNFSVTITRMQDASDRSSSSGDSVGSMYQGSTTKGYIDLAEVFGDDAQGIPDDVSWSLTITDGDDPSVSASKVVQFTHDGQQRLRMKLEIDSSNDIPDNPPDSLTRDIVLVLDDSGSMAGDPVEEVRTACLKFSSTVFGHNARVSVVSFESSATVESEFTDSQDTIDSAVKGLNAAGGTNIEDGLKHAEDLLAESTADRKIIILMTDGEPNNGLVDDDLVQYADDIKKSGVYVYTLGFFSGLTPGTKSAPQQLLERIASEGCHYEIGDASDLQFFFGDIADEINGTKYNYIRIACPVDVTVSYNGETLSSAGATGAVRSSFGTLTFEEAATNGSDGSDGSGGSFDSADQGEIDQVKVLRLVEGPQYEVSINGTGTGVMNYQIGFVDDYGTYSDMRYFDDIAIGPNTKITTVAAVSDQTLMRVDSDGDGTVDKTYAAGQNSHAVEVDNTNVVGSAMHVVMAAALAVACALVAVWLLLVRRARRKEKAVP